MCLFKAGFAFLLFRSNASDEKFDLTVGALEDIVMGMKNFFFHCQNLSVSWEFCQKIFP